MNGNKLRVSIIIPVYNESEGISKLLKSLNQLLGKCEIIFSDGGSTDGTVAQIEQWIDQSAEHCTPPCAPPQCLTAPEKGRARQMNYGALHASGNVLWFVHADSILPKNPLRHIEKKLAKGYQVGCFRIRFDSMHPLMLYNSLMSNNFRVPVLGTAFGDQGIFIMRDLFDKLGGFANIPLMEDYQLSLDIKEAGLKFGIVRGQIKTSARRFRRRGPVKTMLWMRSLQQRFRNGDDIEEIANEYRGKH
ncbi:MAG: TIGR04283 family arsenosugar biosynthesis glycosyltransferase [Oscillospiraceae bacterium]|nr:TIGR04283 family arsenosugar biosynthesis glycosyltransferase [Oscillospiraceae bacterium]